MAGGRNTTPLFDLIGPKTQATPARPVAPRPAGVPPEPPAPPRSAKPVVRLDISAAVPDPSAVESAAPPPSAPSRVEPMPEPIPAPPPAAVVEAPRPAPTPSPDEQATPPRYWYSPLVAGDAVRLPVNLAYLLSGIAVLVLILSWTLGYSSGKVAGERAGERLLRRDVVLPTEPLPLAEVTSDGPPAVAEPRPSAGSTLPPAVPTSTGATAGSGDRSGAGASPTRATPTAQVPVSGTEWWSVAPPAGAIITAQGYLVGEIREAGKNYLALATLGWEDAAAAVRFLGSERVEAFAVPMERRSGAANNQGPSFRVYALPGITGEQYARKMTVRTNLEAAVARAGRVWRDRHQGASDFARVQWEKFR